MNSKFTYENQGTNTYLVYTVPAEETVDSMSLGMLTNNRIPGLAPTLFTQMDSTKYIKYNVSAHIPASQFFAGAVNKKRLLGVFKGIVSAILSAEAYMIDESSILLNLDYIFADVTSCETILICMPIEQEASRHDLGAFFKGIMFTTQFDQTENCDYVARIINYLNSTPLFSLENFSDLLDQIEQAGTAVAPAPQLVQPKVTSAQPVAPAPQPVAPAPQPVAPAPQPVAPAPQPAPRQSATAPLTAPIGNTRPQQKAAPKPVAPAIPKVPQMPRTQPQNQAQSRSAENEKPMSWLYLMQHYNKENAEIYKAQQEAAKAKKGAKNAPQPAPQPAPQKQAKAKPQPTPGFAVPGQAAPNFAVPGQTPPQPVAAPQPAPQPVQPKVAPAPQPVAPTPQPVAPAPQPVYQSSMPLNFGETTVLSGPIGETTVLGVSAEPNRRDPHLIRTKNNEKIPLNKPVFRIGKERSYVDYFIGDNTAISRGHANVIDHNGEYFVVDTNSTNHTYVNGVMIQSGVETKLSHGDKIRLANEDFEFKLY